MTAPREHPVTEMLLKYGEAALRPGPSCAKCGAPAQVGRLGVGMCRACALDSWQLLSEPRRLELMGFERL